MTKTIKNVYERIFSMENIELAYRNAAKHKRYTYGALEFTASLTDCLATVQRRIRNGDTAPVSLRCYFIHEPKLRLIWEQSFEQCVISWAFYQLLQPLFVKGYITDTYACIEGRGQVAAVERLYSWMGRAAVREQQTGREWYVLKLDISKFFYRIPHDKLLQVFDRKVSDKGVREWARQQLKGSGHRFGLPPGTDVSEAAPKERLANCGMPIGTLFAQMIANLYMNELDQYAKRALSLEFYIRYNDDIIVLMEGKEQLWEVRGNLERFLTEKLGLDPNPKKTAIRPMRLGVEFCGRRIFTDHYRLRKSTALAVKRNLKGVMKHYSCGELPLEKAMQTVQSYQALLAQGNNQALRRTIFGNEEGQGGWFLLKKEEKWE